MGFLLFSLIQMQGYANIINDAGIVRGGTQRCAKLEPVSYTHLDVYKRQLHDCLSGLNQLLCRE